MSKSFENRLKWIEQNCKELEEQREQWSLDEEIEEHRLKRRSTEYSKFGGVRDL